MKKKSLKILAALTALTVLTTGLAGCVKNVNISPASETPSEQPSANWEEPSGGRVEQPGEVEDTESLLLEFVEGNATAFAYNANGRGLEASKDYTLDQLVDAVNASLEDDFVGMGKKVCDVSYALIDCGNDGVPELALWVSSNDESGYDEVTDYYIIKENAGLVIEDGYESYYRSFGTLNKYGVFCLSGSGGAASGGTTYYRVNAEGEHELIYGVDYELCLEEPLIPGHRMPSNVILPEGYPEYSEGYGSVELNGYYFIGSSSFDPNDKETYNRYLKSIVYVFRDGDDSVFPKNEYSRIYSEAGITITDQDGIDAMIQDRLSELNMTEDELRNPEEYPELSPAWVMVRDYVHTENQGG